MQLITWSIITALVAPTCVLAQAMNRCVGQDGKVEYTDRFCSGSAKATSVLSTSIGAPTAADREQAQERLERDLARADSLRARDHVETLARERLSVDKRQVDAAIEKEKSNDSFLKEQVSRYSSTRGTEWRSRAEWIEYDKARAAAAAIAARTTPQPLRDQFGNTYSGNIGTVIRQDGRPCFSTGASIRC